MLQVWRKLAKFVGVVAFGMLIAEEVSAAVPRVINYQGFLTNNGTPVTATVSMTFKLYSVPSGGAEFYTETQSVSVTDGAFSVGIGSVTPIPDSVLFDQPYWLGITVAGEAELMPRVAVSATPYAMRAISVETVATSQLTGTIGTAQIANGAVTQGKLSPLSGAANGKVLGTDGTNLRWQDPTPLAPTNNVSGTSLDFAVNGGRVMRYEANANSPNVIGGAPTNSASPGVRGATIGGGGVTGDDPNFQFEGPNTVTDAYGTIGGGYNNRAGNFGAVTDTPFATVGGGAFNTADGAFATVAGGGANHPSGPYSSVGGGENNQAQGDHATVSGGAANLAHGGWSSIGGGQGNSITLVNGLWSVVGGGNANSIDAGYAMIGGGKNNGVTAGYAVIGGGNDNHATGTYSTIGGGNQNATQAAFGAIGGGSMNTTQGSMGHVGGGFTNLAGGDYANVAGGDTNSATYDHATVGGGGHNQAIAPYSTVGGGDTNTAGFSAVVGVHATVGGGQSNFAKGNRNTVGGGKSNATDGESSTIGGGNTNQAGANYSTIAGGRENKATVAYSAVGGGWGNWAQEDGSYIGGGVNNRIPAAALNATIGGGFNNNSGGSRSTVSGGDSNSASAMNAVVGGGTGNVAGGVSGTGANSVVGGGANNKASNINSTVAGGNGNQANGQYATVMGGSANNANGNWAMIPGGLQNTADGSHSFAAGYKANITNGAPGSFYWHDFVDDPINWAITGANRFYVIARGGVEFVTVFNQSTYSSCYIATGDLAQWNCSSDRNAKTDFEILDGVETLRKLGELPIYRWRAKGDERKIPHAGPTAQDFKAAFGLGADDRTIGYTDAFGVAMSAIQGLYRLVEDKDLLIRTQSERIAVLEAKSAHAATFEARLKELEAVRSELTEMRALLRDLRGQEPTLASAR